MDVKVIKNDEKKGLELYFSDKPEKTVIDFLKENHFRWHNVKKCWYAKNTEHTIDCVEQIQKDEFKIAKRENKKSNFEFDVKIGDIFVIDWGYEQTNLNFFQVVKLCGTKSVRVVEVHLTPIESHYMSGDARFVTFDINSATPLDRSHFIKDQTNGDLFRVKSYDKDAFNNPSICISGRYPGSKYYGGQRYESWGY